ncbi:hypothetical protein HBI56_150470 [Parastagonospora nodorum]|nr:hypothetical protein HBH56_184060 [Parastagonospora nodorum]KAH3926019.1 hypothetical protein HBH54_173210 [Parastagonospora nodorum]KAH3944906.1 hypothetical protein HBH53_151730 [Parastagonospora nodorum]KAH3995467.1 hypothetical protein HBI10_173770 [Parastagonospora nodorum]KAH4016080.1 hypothetical protein HBI13_152990 [Parastagonospora nodorum]
MLVNTYTCMQPPPCYELICDLPTIYHSAREISKYIDRQSPYAPPTIPRHESVSETSTNDIMGGQIVPSETGLPITPCVQSVPGALILK